LNSLQAHLISFLVKMGWNGRFGKMKIDILFTMKKSMIQMIVVIGAGITSKNNLNGEKINNHFCWIKILNLRVKFLFYCKFKKFTNCYKEMIFFLGKLKTAKYWPFIKCNLIGLALNLKIISFKWRNNDPPNKFDLNTWFFDPKICK